MIFPRQIFIGVDAARTFCQSVITNIARKKILFLVSPTVYQTKICQRIVGSLGKTSPYYLESVSSEPDVSMINTIYTSHRNKNIGVIVGIGGGSVLDTAKAIAVCLSQKKLCEVFLENWNEAKRIINLYLLPTTAGSGSEVTSIAVIKMNNTKKVIVNDSLVPDAAILDPEFLNSTPLNLRLVAMLDAASHAIEPLWSKNSNIVTDFYSLGALNTILRNYKDYLAERKSSNHSLNTQFQVAAMHAGFAFNTAGVNLAHAFAYALTEQIPLPHGQSVAIALLPVLEYLDAGKINQIIAVKKYKEFIKQTIILVNNYAKIIYNVRSVNLDYHRMVTSVKNNKRLMSRLPIKISDDELLLITNKINEKITSFSVK